MAKYCAKCGKPLPDGTELCPDCHVAAEESEAALFTRMTAETEIWKHAETPEKKPKRKRKKKTRSQRQKLAYAACALAVAAFAVFALLFTRPAAKVVRAVKAGDYDSAIELYWGTPALAEGGENARIDSTVMAEANRICERYAAQELGGDEAALALSKLGTLGDGAAEMLADVYAGFRELSGTQSRMDEADKLFRNGEYLAAREIYLTVAETDGDFSGAQTRAEECLTRYADSVLSDANLLIQSGDYAGAITAMEACDDTLYAFGTFSGEIDEKLEKCYALYEEFTLSEAGNLAALEDYEAAAALIRQNAGAFDLESDALRTAMEAYDEQARLRHIFDTASAASALYAEGTYTEAFQTLEALKDELAGDTADVDAEIAALEARYAADTLGKAEAAYGGSRDNLTEALALLDGALAVRPMESVAAYRDELAEYLPVSLAEADIFEKEGVIFRNSGVFEGMDGVNYNGGWLWGEDGSSVTFRLEGRFDVFTCTFAMRRDDNVNANGHFEVWGDGELLYKSETLYHWETESIPVSLEISGCTELKLCFVCDYNVSTAENGYCYHGVCDPVLTKNIEEKEA